MALFKPNNEGDPPAAACSVGAGMVGECEDDIGGEVNASAGNERSLVFSAPATTASAPGTAATETTKIPSTIPERAPAATESATASRAVHASFPPIVQHGKLYEASIKEHFWPASLATRAKVRG
jgi:hypothetical protein